MRIEYKDKKLARLETDRAAETKLPVEVIESFRRKRVLLEAAVNEENLRHWKSFHYEKLRGDREGQRSIRLNLKWRLVFELDTTSSPPTIWILEIIDYH